MHESFDDNPPNSVHALPTVRWQPNAQPLRYMTPAASEAEISAVSRAIRTHPISPESPHVKCCAFTEEDVLRFVMIKRATLAGFFTDIPASATHLARAAMSKRMHDRLKKDNPQP